ncbi:MAG: serine/threonine-protein kinase [Sedimentisphaerales bacterium]|nr:serine/threonine-protein kinase [Sedimentisphaerales bacterium]
MVSEILNLEGFSILKRLGAGARSVIYLAVDEEKKRQVALKRAIYERPEDTRIFEQMEAEYKVAKAINHHYIRKCYQLIKIRNFLSVREVLLSMEVFDGQTLEDSPGMSLIDVMLVFRMVADGLHAMHEQGYIHCDIKPNNILVGSNGSIKIIDLGQSCRIGTTKTRIQGTPDYIAPEQVRRQPLDQRTDIFNLGATMYWALTGKNVPTLIPKKNEAIGFAVPKQVLSPHELKSQIPVGISKLVMDCVKDSPSERPLDMNTVVSRIDILIHSLLGNKRDKNGSSSN